MDKKENVALDICLDKKNADDLFDGDPPSLETTSCKCSSINFLFEEY